MDYEKKYKEALGWMQSLYNGLHGKTKEEAEKYFPELKDSKDEQIRKGLITALGSIGKRNWGGIDVFESIAWLEKQGEQKSPWSDEDENVLEDIEEAIINYWHGDTKIFLLDWLKSLKERLS